VTKAELGNLLHFYPEHNPLPTILCQFHLMKCTGANFREDNLIQFMLRKVVFYVLQKKEYQDAKFEDARDLFIRAERTFSKAHRTGEAGELLLFLLLEANDIVQLFSKMNLKTSANMPFHGVDAIHIQVGKEVKLHFGHSKMYADFTSGLDSALNDVKRFKADRLRQAELYLLSSHIDASRFEEYTDVIKSLINPYESNRELYKETNAIFIASNEDFMKSARKDEMTLDAFMRDEYEKRQSSITSLIADKVSAIEGIKGEELFFLMMPMVDVDEFRAKFSAELIS
jgi:hypothetical protein